MGAVWISLSLSVALQREREETKKLLHPVFSSAISSEPKLHRRKCTKFPPPSSTSKCHHVFTKCISLTANVFNNSLRAPLCATVAAAAVGSNSSSHFQGAAASLPTALTAISNYPCDCVRREGGPGREKESLEPQPQFFFFFPSPPPPSSSCHGRRRRRM